MSVQSQPHTRHRLLPSTKIAIGFIALAAGGYFGLKFWSSRMIDDFEVKYIRPGRVNILGVNVGSGYRIVVQNRVAVLEIGNATDFSAPDREEDTDPGTDTGGKRRVPIKEMLGSLQGDPQALGRFVMVMNEIKESEFPPVRVDWKAEDVQKALGGDKELLKKLQSDLGVDLKGKALPKLHVNSLMNGIIIHSPLKVRVASPEGEEVMTATIMQAYRSRLGLAVEAELEKKLMRGNDRDALQSIVRQQAQLMAENPARMEDVEKSLRSFIDPKRLQNFAAPAERVLASATVVINDDQMEGASFTEAQNQDGHPFYTLRIDLTDEGRKRLWKYSRGRNRNQLLVVKDGVAIAAPVIGHELSGSNVDVTQLQEEVLVKQTVELIKQLREGSRTK